MPLDNSTLVVASSSLGSVAQPVEERHSLNLIGYSTSRLFYKRKSPLELNVIL